MADDRARHLSQLRQAYESGALEEETYHALVAALGGAAETRAAVEGSGAIAQGGSAAAGAGGVAVAGDVQGASMSGRRPRTPPRRYASIAGYWSRPAATCPCAASTWGPAIPPATSSGWG